MDRFRHNKHFFKTIIQFTYLFASIHFYRCCIHNIYSSYTDIIKFKIRCDRILYYYSACFIFKCLKFYNKMCYVENIYCVCCFISKNWMRKKINSTLILAIIYKFSRLKWRNLQFTSINTLNHYLFNAIIPCSILKFKDTKI